MRKSLGSKRKELFDVHIDRTAQLFSKFVEEKQDGKPISRICKQTTDRILGMIKGLSA